MFTRIYIAIEKVKDNKALQALKTETNKQTYFIYISKPKTLFIIKFFLIHISIALIMGLKQKYF